MMIVKLVTSTMNIEIVWIFFLNIYFFLICIIIDNNENTQYTSPSGIPTLCETKSNSLSIDLARFNNKIIDFSITESLVIGFYVFLIEF